MQTHKRVVRSMITETNHDDVLRNTRTRRELVGVTYFCTPISHNRIAQYSHTEKINRRISAHQHPTIIALPHQSMGHLASTLFASPETAVSENDCLEALRPWPLHRISKNM